MIRCNLKRLSLLPSFFPFFKDPDVVTKDTKTAIEADTSIALQDTGWERLQQTFRKDDFGRLSPELHTIIQVACMSSFIGALYGGITNSREAYIDFIKNNQATAFLTHLDAKRKLQDKITLSFARGAFRWGWRLTAFSTTYVTVSTAVGTYRGKNGILEHVIAGGVAGSSYKFMMGPRGWIVGGGLGIVLGTIAGFVTNSILSLTGMTMEEVRYWNYKWVNSRTEAFNKEVKVHLEKEQIKLLTEHTEKFENADLTLTNVKVNAETKK